jgi:hypothetical protein
MGFRELGSYGVIGDILSTLVRMGWLLLFLVYIDES